MMSFCTAINCMDGRVQLPVIDFLKSRFNADYVDTVTEPGPNLILAKQADSTLAESILHRVSISVERHDSVGIAIVAHHDCAGNRAAKEDQIAHLRAAIQVAREWRFRPTRAPRQTAQNLEIIGLWVDENWEVHELP